MKNCIKCDREFNSERLKVKCCSDCIPKCNDSRHRFKQRADNPKIWILYRVRQNAKTRGIACSLTLEDIPNPTEFCPVFPWIRLVYEVGKGRSDGSISLDRIDSTKGYIAGNVRLISDRANTLKRDATDKELLALGKDASGR